MGKWYDSSIKMYGHSFRQASYAAARTTRAYGIMSSFGVNLFNLTQDGLLQCDQEENSVLHAYCRDFVDLAILHHGCTSNVILHLGDSIPETPHKDVTIYQYPVINKVRHFCDSKYREQTGSDLNPTCGTDTKIDTIIWPMNRIRHLAPAAHVYKDDIPWSDKIGKAIWRGGYNDPFGMKTKYELVSKHVDSDLVDAKFAKRTNKRGRGKTKEVDQNLMGPFISQEEQLKYKYLISIEGNDVSSGLKWMLMSNSVVLLPPTTYESWAMEGLLEPFVHYIPIKSDASDVEEKIQWAEDNPDVLKRSPSAARCLSMTCCSIPMLSRMSRRSWRALLRGTRPTLAMLPPNPSRAITPCSTFTGIGIPRSDRSVTRRSRIAFRCTLASGRSRSCPWSEMTREIHSPTQSKRIPSQK